MTRALTVHSIYSAPEHDAFVVAAFTIGQGVALSAHPPRVFGTLDAARESLPPYLSRFLPTPGEDPPDLVESWL